MPLIRNVAIILFVVWVFADAVVVFRRKTGEAENRDRSSLRVLMSVGPVIWWVAIYLSYTRFGAVQWPWVQVAGLAVMGLGIVLRSVAIHQLGRFHTPNVAIRADHQLLETGLYSVVRHPSYLGALLGFIGFAMTLDNVLSLVLFLLATPALYLYRIREEDAVLLAAFGDRYRAYCARTKRLIPWVY